MDDKEKLEAIEEIMAVGNMTRWEDRFLTSVADQLARGWGLTEDQERKLQEILDAKL